MILCAWSVAAVPILPIAQRIKSFQIPAKHADESLIEFARQADLTIIFPYEKVKNSLANGLHGDFSVQQGISKLLENTDLTAEFDQRNVVTIKVKSAKENDSLLTEFLALLTASDERLVIFPQQEDPDYELIVVKGIRGSIYRSMDIKHSSSGIVDAIKSEDIGKFPDLNLAESLQRITGVSIDRAEGEGQFVTVRGFGPQFNTVLTNGRRLATDNQGREFSFDTLAAELVSGVKVHKTFSASQQSGGIGSVIDIETARPLNNRGYKVVGSLKSVYDTNSEELSPQGTVLLSHSNDKFGWLMSLSHQERKARINEVQTDAWLLNTDIPASELQSSSANIFVPRNYDQRVRFDTRTRTGGTVVLQYRPTNQLDMSIDYLASSFAVKTDSTSMGHWFTSSNLENVVTDDNGTVVQFEQNVGHATDFHARTFDRPSNVSSLAMNIDWRANENWQLEWDISLSDAATKDTQGAANALSLIGYLNRSKFDHSSGNVLPIISGFEEANSSILNAQGEPSGVADYLEPDNGRAHVMLRRGWNIRDDFDQMRWDASWDAGRGNLTAANFGVMYSQQTKRNERWDNEKNAVHCTFCGYFDNPDIPNSFQTHFFAGDDFLKGTSGSEYLPKNWLRHDGEQLFQFLENASGISFDAVLRNNSFSVKEDVMAAYAELDFSAQWANMRLSVLTGLRYESTDTDVVGIETDLLKLTVLDQTELGQTTSPPRPIEQKSTYHNWLPSLSAKLEVTDQLLTRLAFSRSLTRPTMSQMSPSLVLDTTRQGGDLRASSGNPQLLPFESTNIDVAVEWYFAPSSYLSTSYFQKRVDNFIVSTTNQLIFAGVTDPSTGTDPREPDPDDTLAQFDLTAPNNGQTATVKGWEFAVQHNFASGFGLVANMTTVDSNAQLDPNDIAQKFALTGLSDSQNIIVYYEGGPVQVRFAWNHRDGFLQSLVQRQGPEPTFVESYQQLDMNASYAVNGHLVVFVEGVNITDETVLKHGRYDNQLLLVQEPGARYALGLRGSF
ncbi:MAG: iron complex outermembrane receptor protein [Paraglaciecola sp.]|jgi:iron complex outermembrane receptor protein